MLNARDAARRGATILTRTRVVSADRRDGLWAITTEDTETGERTLHRARRLVNAAGPWVGQVLTGVVHSNSADTVRLVRGSHIVTRRLFDHDKCYFFQGSDGRILFAIPYEEDFTLIGTTDQDHDDPDTPPVCTEAEQDYMVEFVNRYLRAPISKDDIVWTYSGVRPLYSDGAGSATAATRDYTLKLEGDGAPLLNVFGGKITTYRRLAEAAMDKLHAVSIGVGGKWTAGTPLPGGDFEVEGVGALTQEIVHAYPFTHGYWARRLVRAYGTEVPRVLGQAKTAEDLGEDFGATLTEREVVWLMDKEWARTAEDVVWRRSKLGLRMTVEQIARLDEWMAARREQAS